MASQLPVDEEVASLKEQYGRQCRVMKNVGDYMYMVDVKVIPEGALTLKIHIEAGYSSICPDLLVRCDVMQDEQRQELQQYLEEKAASLKGSPMLHHLVNITQSWLDARDLRDVLKDDTVQLQDKGSKSGKHKQKKNKKKTKKEDDVDEKLPSMKTADDVISRVMWDENLPTDSFIVGYLDRFTGIQEKLFTSFSWEDLASVDYTVLAIPKHRIQYFKYKTVKVWDKVQRLDLIFGSTGDKKTINDVMNEYVEPEGGWRANQKQFDNDDDSDDDDVQINVGDGGAVSMDAVEEDFDDQWTDKLRPNHFICIRVTDPEVLEGVSAVQDAMLEEEERYGPCFIPTTSLHVTLCTLGLDTPEQIADASRLLTDAREEILEMIQPGYLKNQEASSPDANQQNPDRLSFPVAGMDHFYDRVVYARVHWDHHLFALSDYVRALMTQGGVDIRDAHALVPHMTVMKTTRPVSRQMSTCRVERSLWEGFAKMHFGRQTVDGLYLCEMSDRRRDDGFYVTPASVQF